MLALIVSANAVSAGLAAVSDRYPDCETLINGLVRALVLSLSITLAFVALAKVALGKAPISNENRKPGPFHWPNTWRSSQFWWAIVAITALFHVVESIVALAEIAGAQLNWQALPLDDKYLSWLGLFFGVGLLSLMAGGWLIDRYLRRRDGTEGKGGAPEGKE